MKLMEKKCKTCGDDFVTGSPIRTWCSSKCFGADSATKIIKDFEAKKISIQEVLKRAGKLNSNR
ncbi:hypothetical protein GOV11_00780 [Candidatus Woesearchaeota archaeon]|nr:hypothetical protein [Candidatus Woesearchaeota archaeon]